MATTMNAQQMQSVFPKNHVGFDSITNQIEKKLLKRGFQFNVICVGAFNYIQSFDRFPAINRDTQCFNRSIYTAARP